MPNAQTYTLPLIITYKSLPFVNLFVHKIRSPWKVNPEMKQLRGRRRLRPEVPPRQLGAGRATPAVVTRIPKVIPRAVFAGQVSQVCLLICCGVFKSFPFLVEGRASPAQEI